jgi:hypothetical protein
MSKESIKSGGIGFIGLLTVAFIVLKLVGKITWSWLWVLSPAWIPFAVVFVLLIAIGIRVMLKD